MVKSYFKTISFIHFSMISFRTSDVRFGAGAKSGASVLLVSNCTFLYISSRLNRSKLLFSRLDCKSWQKWKQKSFRKNQPLSTKVLLWCHLFQTTMPLKYTKIQNRMCFRCQSDSLFPSPSCGWSLVVDYTRLCSHTFSTIKS